MLFFSIALFSNQLSKRYRKEYAFSKLIIFFSYHQILVLVVVSPFHNHSIIKKLSFLYNKLLYFSVNYLFLSQEVAES